MRYYYRDGRTAVAQEWMNKLSGPKRHHLSLMLGRPAIMGALDQLLSFPGLWFGLQLGNWAKHLAAHVDECIINYLSHIYNFYSGIMEGHEDMTDQLDEITIAQLQHRSPSWSSQDRTYIEKGFQKGTLFPGVQSSDIRNIFQERIKSFTGIIPSIMTFHENMKYLTIGVKILEKFIEIRPPIAEGEKYNIHKVRPDLFSNLKANWNLDVMKIQVDHETFVPIPAPVDAELCFIQLVIAAIRHFAFLNLYEAPLMDQDKKIMGATIDLETQGHLCWIAGQLGFDNLKIQAGASQKQPYGRSNSIAKPKEPTHRWRAGKPFREVFLYLEHHSFLLQFLPKLHITSKTPSPLSIQGDIFGAFFNWNNKLIGLEEMGPDEQPPGDPPIKSPPQSQDQNTSGKTIQGDKKENSLDDNEFGGTIDSSQRKAGTAAANSQATVQLQESRNPQSTTSKRPEEKRQQPSFIGSPIIKPIRKFMPQRHSDPLIPSRVSTVSAIDIGQQENVKQDIDAHKRISHTYLYPTIPPRASAASAIQVDLGQITREKEQIKGSARSSFPLSQTLDTRRSSDIKDEEVDNTMRNLDPTIPSRTSTVSDTHVDTAPRTGEKADSTETNKGRGTKGRDRMSYSELKANFYPIKHGEKFYTASKSNDNGKVQSSDAANLETPSLHELQTKGGSGTPKTQNRDDSPQENIEPLIPARSSTVSAIYPDIALNAVRSPDRGSIRQSTMQTGQSDSETIILDQDTNFGQPTEKSAGIISGQNPTLPFPRLSGNLEELLRGGPRVSDNVTEQHQEREPENNHRADTSPNPPPEAANSGGEPPQTPTSPPQPTSHKENRMWKYGAEHYDPIVNDLRKSTKRITAQSIITGRGRKLSPIKVAFTNGLQPLAVYDRDNYYVREMRRAEATHKERSTSKIIGRAPEVSPSKVSFTNDHLPVAVYKPDDYYLGEETRAEATHKEPLNQRERHSPGIEEKDGLGSPEVDSNRSSEVEPIDPVELSPHNSNRNVGMEFPQEDHKEADADYDTRMGVPDLDEDASRSPPQVPAEHGNPALPPGWSETDWVAYDNIE